MRGAATVRKGLEGGVATVRKGLERGVTTVRRGLKRVVATVRKSLEMGSCNCQEVKRGKLQLSREV